MRYALYINGYEEDMGQFGRFHVYNTREEAEESVLEWEPPLDDEDWYIREED